MKILVIGDIHGCTDWEQIVKDNLVYNNIDHVIFLGDYVDSFHIKPPEILKNLLNVIDFAKKHEDKCTLLLGNHDYAYIHNITNITGYNYLYSEQYRQVFYQHKDLFKIAWGYENPITYKYTLATHAGLAYKYWNFFIMPQITDTNSFLSKLIDEPDKLPIHEVLNYMSDKSNILWKVGSPRGGSGTGGILWADYLEIIEDRYPYINQIFGHTPKTSVQVNLMEDDLIVCCDSWGNKQTANIVLNI